MWVISFSRFWVFSSQSKRAVGFYDGEMMAGPFLIFQILRTNYGNVTVTQF